MKIHYDITKADKFSIISTDFGEILFTKNCVNLKYCKSFLDAVLMSDDDGIKIMNDGTLSLPKRFHYITIDGKEYRNGYKVPFVINENHRIEYRYTPVWNSTDEESKNEH